MAGLEVEGGRAPGEGSGECRRCADHWDETAPGRDKAFPLRRHGRRKELSDRVRRKQHEVRRQGRARKIGTNLPPGPKFPEGMTIKKAKIRGEVSEGMLCAENELGIGVESDGIMILPPSASGRGEAHRRDRIKRRNIRDQCHPKPPGLPERRRRREGGSRITRKRN